MGERTHSLLCHSPQDRPSRHWHGGSETPRGLAPLPLRLVMRQVLRPPDQAQTLPYDCCLVPPRIRHVSFDQLTSQSERLPAAPVGARTAGCLLSSRGTAGTYARRDVYLPLTKEGGSYTEETAAARISALRISPLGVGGIVIKAQNPRGGGSFSCTIHHFYSPICL